MDILNRKLLINAIFSHDLVTALSLGFIIDALRTVYNTKTSFFQELIHKNRSVTRHTRNFDLLATEMFKIHIKNFLSAQQRRIP